MFTNKEIKTKKKDEGIQYLDILYFTYKENI